MKLFKQGFFRGFVNQIPARISGIFKYQRNVLYLKKQISDQQPVMFNTSSLIAKGNRIIVFLLNQSEKRKALQTIILQAR